MGEWDWGRYPRIAAEARAHAWLSSQVDLGLAPSTRAAYARGLEDFLTFSARREVAATAATRAHIAAYVRDLRERPGPRGANVGVLDSGAGLASATMQQRLVVVRLFYESLVEDGVRADNPVGRGRYTAARGFGGERGLIPRLAKLPWIPSDEQWRAVVAVARAAPIRNRLMLALAYDAALRREELCSLQTDDIDPAYRTLRIRAETTKGRRERVLPYSAAAGDLYAAYLAHRRTLSRERGALFRSESRRNLAQPITLWTWTKVVEGIAERAQVPRFTTHTLRHLCLTDLARAGWDLHEIARFAGHRQTQTTLQYIHLSGRDLAAKLERGMAAIHDWRVRLLAEGPR